jgi:hypothetical protein
VLSGFRIPTRKVRCTQIGSSTRGQERQRVGRGKREGINYTRGAPQRIEENAEGGKRRNK